MMNQQYGPGPRGNRGGRANYQQGRYNHNRYPHQNLNFKNPHYNHNINNNSQKCFNQNVDHCTNPNMDPGEYLSPPERSFTNGGGNPPYLGNEPAGYPMEPMFHGHGPPMTYDMPPSFGQPHFAEMGIQPQMMGQMQLLNFPPQLPQYIQPGHMVFNMYTPPPGIPHPPPPLEPFNSTKEGGSHPQSREAFSNETDLIGCQPAAPANYEMPLTPGCANCASDGVQSEATIRELQTEVTTLRTTNRDLHEENATLKDQLQAALTKIEEAAAAEVKPGLSVDAEPFVAKGPVGDEACAEKEGPKLPPDAEDQAYEKACSELIEIIKDPSEDTWSSPDVPINNPQLPSLTIPVVSANGSTPWSEMIENETDAPPPVVVPVGDFNSRGRVSPEEHSRRPEHPVGRGRGPGHLDSGRNPGHHDPGQGVIHQDQGPGPNEFPTRGTQRRQDNRDNRRNQDYRSQQQPFPTRGLHNPQQPDSTENYTQQRGALGGHVNRGNLSQRGFRAKNPRGKTDVESNWRVDMLSNTADRPEDKESSNPPPAIVSDHTVSEDHKPGDDKRIDVVEVNAEGDDDEGTQSEEVAGPEVVEKRVEDMQLNEQKREESRERPKGGRSSSYKQGGSGDRARQQPVFVGIDARKSKKTQRKKK